MPFQELKASKLASLPEGDSALRLDEDLAIIALWHPLTASVSIRRFGSEKLASVALDSLSAKCWDIWQVACLKRRSCPAFLNSHMKMCWPVLPMPLNASVAPCLSLPLEGPCACCWTKTFQNLSFPQ